jgi:hypothetical protein
LRLLCHGSRGILKRRNEVSLIEVPVENESSVAIAN